MKKIIATGTFFLVSAVISSSVIAQQSYRDCAVIKDDQERLMCYDRLHEQDKKPVPTAKMKEKVERERQNNSEFGLEHKKLKKDERITVQITERDENAYGKWILTFDNGQVWKQEGSDSYFPWQDGATYFVERGMFNAFYLTREGVNKRLKIERIK